MSSDNQRLQLSIEQKNGKIRSLENKYVREFVAASYSAHNDIQSWKDCYSFAIQQEVLVSSLMVNPLLNQFTGF